MTTIVSNAVYGLGILGSGWFWLFRTLRRSQAAHRVRARVAPVAALFTVLLATAGTADAQASRPRVSASFAAVGRDISADGTVSAGRWYGTGPRSRWIVALQQRVGARWLLRASGHLHARGNLSGFSLTWADGSRGRRDTVRVEVVSGKRIVATSANRTIVATVPVSTHAATRSSSIEQPTWGLSLSSGSPESDASRSSVGATPTFEAFDATQVTSGGENACVLLKDRGVDCWGSDLDGVLGIDETWQQPSDGATTGISFVPTPVARIGEVTQISAGYFYVCALSVAGNVYCWGWDGQGELGNGESVNYDGPELQPADLEHTIPEAVPGLKNVVQVAAGAGQACALLPDGAIDCWGENASGQLGDGTQSGPETCYFDGNLACSTRPVAVSGISDATQVADGGETSCALLVGGAVDCWGLNRSGALGDGTTTNSDVPVAVSGITDATKIAVGGEDACAVLADGGIDCWGLNEDGQLGSGVNSGPETCLSDLMCSTRPVTVSGIDNAVQVTVGSPEGYGNACALLATGTVKCWGDGGALGDDSYASSDVPVEVSGLNGVVGIATNSTFADVLSCAVLSDGALDCWGDGPGVGSDVPVEVPIPEATPAPE